MKNKIALFILCCLYGFGAACQQLKPSLTPVSESSIPTPLPTLIPTTRRGVLVEERLIGNYTVRLWGIPIDYLSEDGQPATAYNGSHFTIEAPDRPLQYIESAFSFLDMPASDLTGEGNPDVLLKLRTGGSHCCSHTILLDMGQEPVEVLNIQASIQGNWGQGEFIDLDGDGIFEFITRDGIDAPCSAPSVKVILTYEPGAGYVPVSPAFPEQYQDELARTIEFASQDLEQDGEVHPCSIVPIVAAYVYSGQPELARQNFDAFYTLPDAETFWSNLVQALQNGRFYTPTASITNSGG